MSPITTHALDVSRGVPALGMPVRLQQRKAPDRWQLLGESRTDADGRVKDLLPDNFPLEAGIYRLTFDTAAYFRSLGADCFFPFVEIVFEVKDKRHHHVPLLLSPFGYSTYRGS